LNNELKNGKDKIVGKVKEAAGKATDDDELEFKGKLQSMKSDIGNKVEDMKDAVLDKANDLLDKIKGDKKEKK